MARHRKLHLTCRTRIEPLAESRERGDDIGLVQPFRLSMKITDLFNEAHGWRIDDIGSLRPIYEPRFERIETVLVYFLCLDSNIMVRARWITGLSKAVIWLVSGCGVRQV